MVPFTCLHRAPALGEASPSVSSTSPGKKEQRVGPTQGSAQHPEGPLLLLLVKLALMLLARCPLVLLSRHTLSCS